jgi:glycosyltransferase involved in cell wall biosynthesis
MISDQEKRRDDVRKNLSAGLVSIGVPVYNGERYLRETLDSLLAQDYHSFEIIISDNHSTDATEAICCEYAENDPRIRYYRADQNRGSAWNYARTYELARGEYFIWNAHDDLREPTCLSKCVMALENNSHAVMCCMESRLIDEEGSDITDVLAYKSYPPVGKTPRERVMRLMESTAWIHFYAMFRTPIIRQTRFLTLRHCGADIVGTAETCLRGEVIAVPEKLFCYRIFPNRTQEEVEEMQSQGGDRVSLTWLGFAVDLLESVQMAPLGRLEKTLLSLSLSIRICATHPTLRSKIRYERYCGLSAALGRREYQRAVRLVSLGTFSQSLALCEWLGKAPLKASSLLYQRTRNSAKYRGGQFKRLLLSAKDQWSRSQLASFLARNILHRR